MRRSAGFPCALLASLVLTACGPAHRPAPPASRDAIACAHGDARACHAEATTLMRQPGHAAQALPLFLRACDGHVGEACAQAELILAYGHETPVDVPRARALADRECTRGSQRDCAQLGIMLTSIAGIAHDPDRAYWLFRHSCEAGVEIGCEGLVGMRTVMPGGGGGDVRGDEAFETIERACSGDVMAACATVGFLYLLGRGVPRDVPHGLGLLEQACDAHIMTACSNLGFGMIMTSNVAPSTEDAARAVGLLRRACDASVAAACGNLAAFYALGVLGFAQDDHRAFELAGRGCGGGDAASCNTLAGLYIVGRGVARDETRGVQLLRRYCDATFRQTCTSLGRATHRGIGGLTRDDAAAARYAEMGCGGGDLDGCEDLAREYDEGRGVPRDEGRARALREQLCAAGRAASCPPSGDAGVASDAGAAAITGSPTIH